MYPKRMHTKFVKNTSLARQFQEEISMEDAVMCDNGPKEISIFCHHTPEIKVVDLAKDHRGNNECL